MPDENEYEEVRRLLAPLASEPIRPSTIDIRRAIADGRRRVRTRRVAGMGAVAVVAVMVVAGVPVVREIADGPDHPPPVALAPATASPTGAPAPATPAAPTSCKLELLPEPSEAYQSLVTAADPTGRLIAGRAYTSGGPEVEIQVVVWEDGQIIRVDMPGSDPSLDDLNSHGVGVGISFADGDADQVTGWVYQDGEVSAVPGGRVASLEKLSINERSAIAGARPAPGAEAWEQVVPVVWRTPTSEPEELSSPGPTWTVAAKGVDADGTVVGTGYDLDRSPQPAYHSFVWLPDGTRQELPRPSIEGQAADSFRAESVHDGVVIGEAERWPAGREIMESHTVQYDLRTGEFTNLSQDAPVTAQVWNRHGWAVGDTTDGLALWIPDGGGTLPLQDPGNRAGAEELFVNLVETLSDDGRVAAGQVSDAGRNAHAARWRCE